MYHMKMVAAMLADAATLAEGKLYIHGGAWDTIYLTNPDGPYTHPVISLAFVLRVEYLEALQNIPIAIEILNDDNRAVGVRADGMINVGHSPGMEPGSPIFVPQAITFNTLTFPRAGGYRFKISAAGKELGSVPFRLAVRMAPPQPTAAP
jgi:uncharacterized protein DUF6941